MKKPPLPFRQCPLVKLGSFPLTRHELTLGQFSEDFVCPLYGGRAGAVLTVVTNCPPETGWTRSEATEGVDGFQFQFPFLFFFAFSCRA